ncbi:hypothetical protein JZ751_018350 [Albula glossodonta]|uniref:Uncharacterized protein n=1 Tax=Albula glossodonta TaxID=121402 RepID=A0A8T2NWT2_9TELE|nr:hypothetical protein JZ751_018350 [Albula glossodonta]
MPPLSMPSLPIRAAIGCAPHQVMKLSADRRSLATRVSHMSFTRVLISSALGMLSEALPNDG